MILDKKIKIKVNSAQLKNLINKGLKVSVGDEIEIPINYLSNGSNIEINCECDVCGVVKKHTYRRYLKSTKNGGYYACSTKCAQNKVKQSFLEKYGEEHHFKSKQTKDKIKNTFKRNYGTEHFSHSDSYQEKVKNIVNKRKQTVENQYSIKEDILEINKYCFKKYCNHHNGYYEIEKKLYHTRKQCDINTCTVCFPPNDNVSIVEKDLLRFIMDNYDGDIIPNFKLKNKEIDIFIPKLKLGFEFNGLYWHSELHRSNDYHYDKTEFFESNGIKLIHIYEDDWFYKKTIIKSRILNLLNKSEKIYARKCEIKEIDSKLCKKFLNDNHIQGSVNSNIKIGLFYDGELVSVMTFGGLRKSLGSKSVVGSWELLRFCNKLNSTVIGGSSKMLKYFKGKYKPTKIISYADRSWSNGNMYTKIGFGLLHKTKPNYYYVINKTKYNRYNFRKDKLILDGFDPKLTERQIMLNRGIYRIYDSGSLVFTT